MDLKERAKRTKSDIPAAFLVLKDKETPIDLVPDFIPVLDYLVGGQE